MSDDEINSKRGPDGKFLPGNKPPRSPGRPPGATNLKARAARLASDRLEAMLGKAADVVDRALDEGDSHVATWLIDRVRPPKSSDFVQLPVPSDLETPREAVEAAREAILAAGRGEVTMSEARAYVDLLTRLGGMQGYLELEQLRERIDGMKVTRETGTFPMASLPQWGKAARALDEG